MNRKENQVLKQPLDYIWEEIIHKYLLEGQIKTKMEISIDQCKNWSQIRKKMEEKSKKNRKLKIWRILEKKTIRTLTRGIINCMK